MLAEHVLVGKEASFAITDHEGNPDRPIDDSPARQSRRMVERENGVMRRLPDERQRPLVAPGRQEKADSDRDCRQGHHDRPPPPWPGSLAAAWLNRPP